MLACIDIPALPLQLVLLEKSEWRDDPVVVVAEHKPLAPILWVNRHARQHRMHPGMRFGAAQALTARLRAAVVQDKQIADAVDKLFRELLHFSPHVEPSQDLPGLFWLDPTGLEGIYGSIKNWAADVHTCLMQQGYIVSVVVGFERYATFAIARTSTGPHIVQNRKKESAWARRVSLAQLSLSSKLLEQLTLLGVHTLGDFLRLPGHELAIRYGQEAAALHRMVSGKTWTPLKPKELRTPITAAIQIEPADDNSERLLFAVRGKLHGLLEQLAKRCEALTVLHMTFHLDHAEQREERIETARPTLDSVQISDLIRLKLRAMVLNAPVEQIDLLAQSIRVHPQQISLMYAKRRDLEAVARALARLKATFGRQVVVQAVLRDAVLPEARFQWAPLSQLKYPKATKKTQLSMARRVLRSPISLPDIPKHEAERWLGIHGAVERMQGPYRINGGWWRQRVMRDYYFVETTTHEILWLYYDAVRRRWKLHGVVD